MFCVDEQKKQPGKTNPTHTHRHVRRDFAFTVNISGFRRRSKCPELLHRYILALTLLGLRLYGTSVRSIDHLERLKYI